MGGTSQASSTVDYCNPDTKPIALTVDPAAIPDELQSRRQWVFWRWWWNEKRQKWDKPPLNPCTGGNASPTDCTTWGTFDAAYAAMQRRDGDGLGFVLTADDPYCVVDLDHCRHPETGALEPWAQAELHRFHTYTELSPTAGGVHLWMLGTLPPKPDGSYGRKKGPREIYDRERYLTVTGHPLEVER